jgi:hypothetical protein
MNGKAERDEPIAGHPETPKKRKEEESVCVYEYVQGYS